MIFVTTGTHYLAFDRLLKMIVELKKKGFIKEKLVVQKGESKIGIPGAVQKKYFGYEETLGVIKKARVVVAQAGPATVFQCLEQGRFRPIIVPRLKKYGEHVSDHQIYFARHLERKSLVKLANSTDELAMLLKEDVELLGNGGDKKLDKLTGKLINYLGGLKE